MWLNSVTLDVSKVTGWLNADVFCRVEGHAIRGARCAGRKVGELGRGAGAGASVARTRRSRDWGQGTRRRRSAPGTRRSCR